MRRLLLFVMLLVPVLASGLQRVETIECTASESGGAPESEEGGCEDECAGCACCPLTPRLTFAVSSVAEEPPVTAAPSVRDVPAPLTPAVPDEILHVPLA